MAEFQTVSAAIGLAGDVIRLIQYLRDVKDAMDTVEEDIDGLIKELQCLDPVYAQLEAEYNHQTHEGPMDAQQQAIWDALRQTLQKGRESIGKVDAEIKKVYGDDPKVQGWFDAFKKQRRLRKSAFSLDGFRDQIKQYNQVLQLQLTRVSLRAHETTQDQLDDLNNSVRSVQQLVREGQETWYSRDNIFDAFAYQAFAEASIKGLEKLAASLPSQEDANVNKYFDTPHPVDSCYVGRDEEAKMLARCLFAPTRDQPRKQKRFVVYGVGGSGKTQFCCKFAQDYQSHFWGVFWIDGRSHQQLQQSLSQNVATKGDVDRNYKAALNWLSNQQQWLLIIDNADDPDIELIDYFPTGARGIVLITTRNPGYQQLGNIEPGYFKFHGMREDEASTLLLRTAGLTAFEAANSAAKQIVEALGYLALAISVAGSTLRRNYCQIHDYLQYFEDMWEERRARAAGAARSLDKFDERREAKIEATFDISYNAIAQKETRASKDALQLIKLFAFLHCEDVRFSFLKKCIDNAKIESEQEHAEEAARNASSVHVPKTWARLAWDLWLGLMTASDRKPDVLPDVLRDGTKQGKLDEMRVRAAMQELTQYSLTIRNDKTDSWSMHPLVHKWAHDIQFERAVEQHVWCEAAASLICNCIVLRQEDDELRRQLLPHVDAVKDAQAKIEERIKDKRLARTKPWPIFETSFSRHRAIQLLKFSLVYLSNGRYKDAVVLQRKVQQFAVKVLGLEHYRARAATSLLAKTLFFLGESDDAALLLETLLEACEKFCAPNDRETLKAQFLLGESRYQQGRVADAKELLRKSLAGFEKFFGCEDEDTLEAMDCLGSAVILSGTKETYVEARQLHWTTLQARQRRLGPNDLKTLESLERFCSDATWNGSHDEVIEAAQGLKKIVEIRKVKLGREHGLTLVAMLFLARVQIHLMDYDAADELFKFMVPTAERNYGKEHMAVLFGRFMLGNLRAKQGRMIEARDILVDVTERQKTSLQGWGRHHYDRIGALRVLAHVHNALGEYEECDEVVRETLKGFENITTVEHPWAAKLQADWAEWRSKRAQRDPP